MSQNPARTTYVHDQSPVDLERLVGIAIGSSLLARESCVRAGLTAGGRAIDVGCGPLGALLVLAELVGPTGAVVGLDGSNEALGGCWPGARRARACRCQAHTRRHQHP